VQQLHLYIRHRHLRPLVSSAKLVSDIAIFVLKRDVKLQLTNFVC